MDEKNTIMRDDLAIDRTKLANQRTLLAYIRTAIMLFASGITFIKFFSDEKIYVVIGIILIAATLPFIGLGIFSFVKIKKDLNKLYSFNNRSK